MTRAPQRQSIFTKRLKEARKRAKLTQEKLGVLAGVDEMSSSARINQYERGTHFPDFGMAQRLASVLRIPVSYLFEGDELLARLILIYGDLKASQRKQLAKLAEEIQQGE